MAKPGPHHFIDLPNDFEVEVPSEPVPAKDHFWMNPSGIYITWNRNRVWLKYAGDKAGQSYMSFELPRDPDYLREFAESISELADKIENR